MPVLRVHFSIMMWFNHVIAYAHSNKLLFYANTFRFSYIQRASGPRAHFSRETTKPDAVECTILKSPQAEGWLLQQRSEMFSRFPTI